MRTPSVPNKDRKEKDDAYERRTKRHTLSIRVHDDRRKEVEDYAKTEKCPHYERKIRLKDKEISQLRERYKSAKNQIFDMEDKYQSESSKFLILTLLFIVIVIMNNLDFYNDSLSAIRSACINTVSIAKSSMSGG